MINNNHKNSGCGFSEALVSYLYDEANSAEKAVFKEHLDNCSTCADELESFSGVHFSINDWKLKEFASLETPIIEIPYGKAEKPAIEVSILKGSWLSGLRNLFVFSPVWSLTTASVAVMAVCVGIALVALNSREFNEIAITNQSKPSILPTADKTPPLSNANSIENNLPDNPPKPKTPEDPTTTGPNSTNDRVVKVSNNQRSIQRTENIRKNKEAKVTNKPEKLPTKMVEDDEEEDDSLRLAELFDEIDTK